MEALAKRILAARNICLTTHRQCDGDGLGAELALLFALKKLNKRVSVINIDATPRKYQFLNPDSHIQYFDQDPKLADQYDICLVFDTNDERLLEPLLPELKSRCKAIIFLDHHPVLEQGPQPTAESIIDVRAASTGELAHRLIKALGVAMDKDIAQAIYTSVTFDTQLYRFIRNSSASHLIAAECLDQGIDAEEVHFNLFGRQTMQKFAFLSRALGQIEYHFGHRVAFLKFKAEDLLDHQLQIDDSRDIIDMIMTIETVDAAVIIREDRAEQFKISFRSKGDIEVSSIAEEFGGGGHRHASGATVFGSFETLKSRSLELIRAQLKFTEKTGS